MIAICIHQSRHSAHTPPPNTNTTHRPQSPQIPEYTVHIPSLEITQRYVLALRQSTTSKIEGDHRDVMTHEVVHDLSPEYPSINTPTFGNSNFHAGILRREVAGMDGCMADSDYIAVLGLACWLVRSHCARF